MAEPIAGMAPTGRKIAAPALDMIELAALGGNKHQALVYQERWRGHPLITSELQGRLGFMEKPEISGIVRLSSHDPAQGLFVYPTGTVWTVAEIVRTYVDNGTAPGVKAGLELCYLVAESLSEAADGVAKLGLAGHGNINPWTLTLRGDGQPLILAYGLPQVELFAWKDDNRLQIGEDSFRYAPPERIETGEEDLSSDLFSLVLVSLEMMVGRPVYDGVLADVKQQAARGEGMRRLYQWREKLPQNVREVMGRALKPDPDTRFPRGLDLVYAVHDLLGSIDVEGPSLTEVMAKVRASEKRGKALKGGQTQLLTPEEMAELAADLQEIEQAPLPPPRRPRPEEEVRDEAGEKPRWSKPKRGGLDALPSRGSVSSSGGTADPRGTAPSARPAAPMAPPASPPSNAPQAAMGRTLSGSVDRRRRLAPDASSPDLIPQPLPQAQGLSAPAERGLAEPQERTQERDRLRRRLRGSNLTPEQLAEPDDVQLEPVADEPAPIPKKLDVIAATIPASKAPPPTLMGFWPPDEDKPSLPGTPVARVRPAEPAQPVQNKPPPPRPGTPLHLPRPEVPRTEPQRVEPQQVEAERSETPRPVPPRAEAPRTDALRSEPPRPDPSRPPAEEGGSAGSSTTGAKSAAAALLEKLRTSGDRRKRLRSTSDDAQGLMSSASVQASQTPPTPQATAPQPSLAQTEPRTPSSTGAQPPGTLGSGAVPREEEQSPRVPPPPVGLNIRTVSPVVSEASAQAAPAQAASPARMVTVAFAGRTHALAWKAEESASSLAVRAATEVGAWRVDPSGRLLGGFRLHRDGLPVPSDALIPPPGPEGAAPYELVSLPSEIRMVEVSVATSPPTRLRTPIETTIPCGWVVNGLRAWLGLSEGDWGAWASQQRIEDDRPVSDALIDGVFEIRKSG